MPEGKAKPALGTLESLLTPVPTLQIEVRLRLGVVAHACNPREGGWHEVRILRPAWPTWWNPVSTKNTKNWLGVVACTCNSSYVGDWGRRITWTQELEVAVSWQHDSALLPGWLNKIRSQKKKCAYFSFPIKNIPFFLVWQVPCWKHLVTDLKCKSNCDLV